MNNQISVVLVVGFLEAGKTCYINELLKKYLDKSVLVLKCEDGEEKLDSFENVKTVFIEYLEDFNRYELKELSEQYHPEVVIAEINGMWPLQNVEMCIPAIWQIEEIHCVINGETFETYSKMMGSLMNEKIRFANEIVFNRVDEKIAQSLRAKNLRLINNTKKMYLQFEDHKESYDNGLLRPQAFTKDYIQISNQDFGYWFADYSADMHFYQGKTIEFEGMLVSNEKMGKNCFAVGRNAMVCCGNDMVFIGLLCVSGLEVSAGSWVKVKGTIKENNQYALELNVPYYVDAEVLEQLEMIEDPIVRF